MISKRVLEKEIRNARRALAAGEHLQVCLWFADGAEVEAMWYRPEVWPVGGVTVTRHQAGGYIARSGNHLDFEIEAGDRTGSRRLAGEILAAAEGGLTSSEMAAT